MNFKKFMSIFKRKPKPLVYPKDAPMALLRDNVKRLSAGLPIPGVSINVPPHFQEKRYISQKEAQAMANRIADLEEERDHLKFVELELAVITAQRDELLAALKQAEEWLSGWASAEYELSVIRAATAKCEVES